MILPPPITNTSAPRPRILVVEDQWLLAETICSEMWELGLEAVGPAYSIHMANDRLQREQVIAAVLNHRLDHTTTAELARTLRHQGCPGLFISAQDDDQAPVDLRACEWLPKPFFPQRVCSCDPPDRSGGRGSQTGVANA